MANTFKFGNGNWATKEDSVLAYNDENNNFKPLPFDFTRASTATYVDSDGLIKTAGNGEARIDYTDSTDGALLLEPSRSNSVTYSEDFSKSYWTKSGPTLTYNQGTSPDGENNATKMIPSTSSTSQDVFATVTASGSIAYTRSFFAKADGYNWIYIQQYDGSTNLGAWFDLSTGSLGNAQSNVTPAIKYYNNGWYKCSVTFTTQSGATSERAQIRVVGNNGASTFAGNGIDGVLIWGAQLEQGSYPTSYIPTSGSAVTRVADVCEGAGNSEVFNDSEGVIYVETKPFIDGDFESGYISLSDGTTGTNFVTIQHRNSGQLRIYAGGFLTPNIQFVVNLDMAQNLKIAVQYKQNDYKLFVNGTKYDLYLTPTQPAVSGLSQLDFNVRGASTHNWCAKTKELKIYNTALTDAELETLTT